MHSRKQTANTISTHSCWQLTMKRSCPNWSHNINLGHATTDSGSQHIHEDDKMIVYFHYLEEKANLTTITFIAVDRGDLVPLVLLDLSAAFDTVDRGCLLSVLNHRFCVDGDALEWFKSYLSDRSQTYIARQDSHGPVSVSCSVPQC